MRIFGVILAGGEGQRMGGADKALVSLGGRSLIWHAIERLHPQVEQTAISANGDVTRFAKTGLPVLSDNPPLGPLSGVLSALEWAAPLGATAVVSVAVDTPFFPGDLVPRLCMAAEAAVSGVAVAFGKKVHPTFGIWPVGLKDSLGAFLTSGAKARVLDFAHSHHAEFAMFPDESAFQNLNTIDDLAKAENLLRGLS